MNHEKSFKIESHLHTIAYGDLLDLFTGSDLFTLPSLSECMEIKIINHPGETSESGNQYCGDIHTERILRLWSYMCRNPLTSLPPVKPPYDVVIL